MKEFLEKMKKIKLIISEVDGIITEGLVNYDELQNVPFKTYHLKDFEAINELKKGFKFVFMSSDNAISYNLFRKKCIPFYWAQKKKKDVIVQILQYYSVTPDEVLFIGSTYSDLECVQMIPLSICPLDSVDVIKKYASFVLSSISGMGVLSELCDLVMAEIVSRQTNELEN
jgi:3-deoxy-D-manno-octulosonate 8-phosphate phosphatase (KDO 8-P phosphatase)